MPLLWLLAVWWIFRIFKNTIYDFFCEGDFELTIEQKASILPQKKKIQYKTYS